jgi:hypothetical protein
MKPSELRPFLGEACRIRLQCRACGGHHNVNGELAAGPNQGEVLVKGHRYSVEDIDEIQAREPRYTWRPAVDTPVFRWSVLLLGGAAALTAWLHMLALR